MILKKMCRRGGCLALAALFCLSAFGEIQITKQPEPVEVPLGASASFSVSAIETVANEAVLYQWYLNGQILPGATNPTLLISSVQSTNLGSYWAKIGNLSNIKESLHVPLTATVGVATEIFPAIELEISTEAGRTYFIQSSSNLVNWASFSDSFIGTGGAVTRFISARSNEHTFYRILRRIDGTPDPAAPSSINGLAIVTTPAAGPITRLIFSGNSGTKTGSYNAVIGNSTDNGSYSYSVDGVEGTANVLTSAPGGIGAKFIFNFQTLHYTKTQNGQLLESGTFSVEK
jgi:hypothetical protein